MMLTHAKFTNLVRTKGHWLIELWCGCKVLRGIHRISGGVKLPPRRCRCERQIGRCKNAQACVGEGADAIPREPG